MKRPTAARIRSVLHYDPKTGLWHWIAKTADNASRCKIGSIAGHANGNGHLQICVDHKFHMAHRLAWLYMTGEWPKGLLDHRNGIPSDNRWKNLRLATRSQNSANAKKRAGSFHPLKGARYYKRNNKWSSQVRVNGKPFYLGLFDTPEQAHAAYVKAAKKHFGAFARAA